MSSVRLEAKKLKASGVKILIALGHAGFKTDKKIASEIPELDVVVGGHTNTFLYSGKSHTYILCPWSHIREKVIWKPIGT